MRRPDRRLKVEKLFVLGAGASFSATKKARSLDDGAPASKTQAPLDSHFCKVLKELEAERPHWVSLSRDLVKHAWSDIHPMENYGLEAAIIRQLGHMDFLDAIYSRSRALTGIRSSAEYLNHIAHLITFTLGRCREARSEPLKRLASHIFPTGVDAVDTKNRIITFNYDELIDTHLLDRFSVAEVYFDRLKERRSAPNRRNFNFDYPLLLKLHGSINWRCGEADLKQIIDYDYSGRAPYKIEEIWHSSRAPDPADDVSPCLIPPLPDKPITGIKLFKFLWTRAFEYLLEAEDLIVCGYSLPDADRLANSLFSKIKNKNLRSVTVIDPNPAIMQKWRSLLTPKNVGSVQWIYYGDFQEYVDAVAP